MEDRNINLANVRVSFPKLVEPQKAQANDPNSKLVYGCDLLLPMNHPQLADFMALVGKVATEKWKEHAGAVLQMIQNDRRMRCFGNGAEKVNKKTMLPYDGYPGMFYISASADVDHPPVIARANGSLIDNLNTMERSAAARKLYGGCYANATIGLWTQDNQFGRAIRCNLFGIQFARDGEAFGDVGPDLSNAFQAIPEQPAPQAMPMPGMPWQQPAPQAQPPMPWAQPQPKMPWEA